MTEEGKYGLLKNAAGTTDHGRAGGGGEEILTPTIKNLF